MQHSWHPTETSDLVVYDLHIYAPQLDWLMVEWLIQIVLQLEVICQFSRPLQTMSMSDIYGIYMRVY